MSEYLDTNHVDTFGILLIEKSQLCPGLYEPILFAYHAYKVDTTGYVSHITKESISAANLMIVPIIEKAHWTLLIGNLKNKVWDFYDSLPKKNHRVVIHQVISHLYDETGNSFEMDI
ncbi:hypothetical protein IEQ34_004877 [Dendrobium chrysotoxum]|uniref:Ubiquitin-like protease family profile domain-containing protein n=1 Tax=Dendrobium chrysotoxum TaxID=161865 RepID=A0AAV7GTI2_DENCH|nr:hypothetical protein IEQ34_004877 [Dendrobium chrysotoxum]